MDRALCWEDNGLLAVLIRRNHLIQTYAYGGSTGDIGVDYIAQSLARFGVSFGRREKTFHKEQLAHARRLSYRMAIRFGASFRMDAAFLGAAGLPTVAFGPHGGGAHAVDEWVDLSSVDQCRAILVRTIRAFSGSQ
jgi:hypothetical protein